MAHAGPGRAGHDVPLLGGHGRADQHHGADAAHRVIDARRHTKVTAGDLLAALQGGLVLAQVQRDTRPLETAIDTILELARLSRRDAPARPWLASG